MKKFILSLLLLLPSALQADMVVPDHDIALGCEFKYYAKNEEGLVNGEIFKCKEGKAAVRFDHSEKTVYFQVSIDGMVHTGSVLNTYVEYNDETGGWCVYGEEWGEIYLNFIINTDGNHYMLLSDAALPIMEIEE